MRSYTITLNEAQAGTIQIACEVLARLGIGQFRDTLEQLPTTEFIPDGWHEDMAAVENILRRHMQPNGQTPHQISTREQHQTAWDLYTLVRHRLSWDRAIDEGRIKPGEPRRADMITVSYDDPHHTSMHPQAKIEEVKK